MKEVLDCIPCYLKQITNTLAQVDLDDDEAKVVMREAMLVIRELDPEGTPAGNATLILHRIYDAMGHQDPFRKAKHETNELALSMLPRLREILAESDDPLYKALQIAAAGNIIDMGIIKDIDVEKSLQEALETRFAKDDYEKFSQKLKTVGEILILGDNSGEIAFDRLLAEHLREQGIRVTYVVKGGPVLNDATLDDARQVGMDKAARVIDTGSNFLGVIFEQASPEFMAELAKAPLVISKGQANYETLESTGEAGNKTFFLLRAKCDIVAKNLGVDLMKTVFAQNQVR